MVIVEVDSEARALGDRRASSHCARHIDSELGWDDDRPPVDRSARGDGQPTEHRMTSLPLDPALERLLRDLAPVVRGAMVRRQRDFAAAEDAVQDALIAAASQWPRDGVPDNPRGWLYRVSQRRLTEHVRSESARRNREAAI
jgi:hypothetical protein